MSHGKPWHATCREQARDASCLTQKRARGNERIKMSSNARQQSELGLYFVNQHRGQWASLGMVLLLLVAAIDYATGFKLRLTIMYLVPVLVLTWVMGRLCGVVLGIVASTCWAYRDALSGRYIDFPSLLYWDW